jgi:hypothetical protein
MADAVCGVTMAVQHKAERGGPDVDGWYLALVIDFPKQQHERLQELIVLDLANDEIPPAEPRALTDLGKGVDSGECWDVGAYFSDIGKEGANKQVGDGTGTGNGTTVRSCVKAANKQASQLCVT